VKVAIGSRPYDGPWGGGNRFVASLCEALKAQGHSVVHELSDRDIDIILIVDPRRRSPNVCFSSGAVLRYLQFTNADAIVIHRINECDERKNEPFINHILVRANYMADVTVFIGDWLAELPIWREHLRPPWYVIRNGADTQIFNNKFFRPWSGEGPLKLVTHHWGYHPMKGFDIYEAIDRMLGDPQWAEKIEFTYVGQLPPGYRFANTQYVPPLDGAKLAAGLAAHHAYVTGSINEPAGMHHIEGALVGLPLLYRESGALPEYCQGFGVPFMGPEDFADALISLIAEYPRLVAAMSRYPWTAERMTRDWIALFENVLASRDSLLSGRRLWREPWRALATQIPV
jgi:glycosyltransferase involved in cell wall biosynthesis